MDASRMPWRIGTTALIVIVAACGGPTPPSPRPSALEAPFASSQPRPTTALTPVATPSPPSTSTADPPAIALVPVVGFWSGTTDISRAELNAALGKTGRYRRVLVAGTLSGATTSTTAAIRKAVNSDPRTLGLLPADQVTTDVHALALDGYDLFGNDRVRDLGHWPLLVPVSPGAVAPASFDPAATWTLVVGGDVMLDRSVYQRTVRQGRAVDYPWDGGFAEITGWHCCTAAGGRLPVVRRTGGSGGLRALFRDADLAVVNLEGPAVDGFRWHPKGLTSTSPVPNRRSRALSRRSPSSAPDRSRSACIRR